MEIDPGELDWDNAVVREPEFVFAPVHVTRLIRREDGHDYEESLTPACDFCLDTRVVWDYPCETFVLEEVEFGSEGDWCACERCAQFIEQRLLPALTLRCLRSHERLGMAVNTELLDRIGLIHQSFFDHRTGPRVPHVP